MTKKPRKNRLCIFPSLVLPKAPHGSRHTKPVGDEAVACGTQAHRSRSGSGSHGHYCTLH